MGQREHIQVVPNFFKADIRAIHPVFFLMVNVETSQTRVDPINESFYSLVVLKEQEEERKKVQHTHSENHAPYDWMRPRKRPVRKCERRDDQKEEYNAVTAMPDIVSKITFVSRKIETET